MIDIKVPEFGESIIEGTISRWLKKEGDAVTAGEALVEIETEKVNAEVSAEQDGVIQAILKPEGSNVSVGETIARLDGEAGLDQTARQNEPQEDVRQAAPIAPSFAAHSDVQSIPVSPSARKKARELGIMPADVPEKNGGREEYLAPVAAIASPASAVPIAAPAQRPPVSASDAYVGKPVERVQMSRRRQTIARRLVEVQQTAAMLTTFNEVDMSAIMEVRKRRKDSFYEKHQVKLGYMSFFTKAVVGALKQFPLLNAELDGDHILLKKYYDIGVAVSTEEGLVVPVVNDADRLSFAEIEQTIAALASKARNRKLTLDDLKGGTFTITNGGTFGSLLSTPILNSPQVGILGMHTIQTRPISIDAERMENRPMMYIALSYDHRIVDGREAVSFLVKLKQLLEDPEALLLEG